MFLSIVDREAFYGGAAGGGKSSALLMGALQFIHEPTYSALLLRKTFADLEKSGGLIPRAMAWLSGTDARKHNGGRSWSFPSGATLSFGYIETHNDVYQYQSAEYQYIGIDEVTQFEERSYRYMFSRLRRLEGVNIPIRMRSGANPGGIGHAWVKLRFIDGAGRNGRWFIPAKLKDNRYLDREEYESTLQELDPVTRRQLLSGDWEVQPEGNMFKREWFKDIIDREPSGIRWTRYWDIAATEKTTQIIDPDWTAGAKVGLKDGKWFIAHINRFRENPMVNEVRIAQQATIDGHGVRIRMEQEPGASGKTVIDHYARKVLVGYDFQGMPSVKDKVSRAGPLSSAAERGNVVLVRGDWISEFLDEAGAFPQGNHDDQVDGVTGAMLSIGIPTGAFASPNDIKVGPMDFDYERPFRADRLDLSRL